jgi:hypothetical protein
MRLVTSIDEFGPNCFSQKTSSGTCYGHKGANTFTIFQSPTKNLKQTNKLFPA